MKHCIGIDLGGTEIKAALFESDSGALVKRNTRSTQDGELLHGVPRWASEVSGLISELEGDAGGVVECIGFSGPGLVARDGRSIAYMPGRLAGLEGFNWTEFLGRSHPVEVLNDGQAALMGEIWQGAAKGKHDVIMLTLGTGVGGAIVSDGRLLRGHIGRAGHLGHATVDASGIPDICGTPGSLEDAIGNHNIGARTGGRFSSTHELLGAVGSGDEEAAAVWNASVRSLAAAIASFVCVLDPELIVIGGGIAKAGSLLFEPLAGHLDSMEWRPNDQAVTIVPAQLGEWAGTYGVAFHALRCASSAPS